MLKCIPCKFQVPLIDDNILIFDGHILLRIPYLNTLSTQLIINPSSQRVNQLTAQICQPKYTFGLNPHPMGDYNWQLCTPKARFSLQVSHKLHISQRESFN